MTTTLPAHELVLQTRRADLRPLRLGDFESYAEVRNRCRQWLTPWEPDLSVGQPDPSKDRRTFAALCGARDRERQLGTGYGFGVFVPDRELNDTRFAGVVNLAGIQRGAFQNAYLGYWIDEELAGQGFVPEAVAALLRFAFEEISLHRVQVAIIPRNARSRRVVEKLGLRDEGIAHRYLKIAGVWEDHVRYAMTTEEWVDRGQALCAEWLER